MLSAVEAGHIPITLAIRIAENPEDEQRALHEAYETKQLRGNRLLLAKKLIDTRRRRGKAYTDERKRGKRDKSDKALTVQDVMKVYQREVDRKRLLTRKADAVAKHINRLSTVMEHKMILRAIERGVPEAKIAAALNIEIKSIVTRRDLLNGICAEAAELLKDKIVPIATFPILKRMKSFRQIEAATLMNDANTYSKTYARMLLAATPKDQLVDPEKPKKIKGLDEDQMARMESEMESLQREYRLIEENYGKDVLNLTLTKGYLGSILGNAKIVRYLAQNHADILTQFQKIADISSLAKEASA